MPPSFNMWMMATVSSPFSLLLELPTYILSLEFCSENNLSKTQIWSCFHIIHFLLRALQRFFTDLRIKFDLNKRSRPFMIYLLPQTVFVTTSLKNMMTQKKPSPHYERSRRTFSVFQLQGTTCFNLIVPCFFSSISFVWKVTPVCCALTSPATFICVIPTCLQNSNETSPSMESLPDHPPRRGNVLQQYLVPAHYCATWFLWWLLVRVSNSWGQELCLVHEILEEQINNENTTFIFSMTTYNLVVIY